MGRTTLWPPCSPPARRRSLGRCNRLKPDRLFPARPLGLPGVGVSTRTRYRRDLHVSTPRRIRLPSGTSRAIPIQNLRPYMTCRISRLMSQGIVLTSELSGCLTSWPTTLVSGRVAFPQRERRVELVPGPTQLSNQTTSRTLSSPCCDASASMTVQTGFHSPVSGTASRRRSFSDL